MHHHWQVVPVPLEKLKVVEQAFRDGAKADTLGEFQKRNPDGEDGDYFRLWIDGEEVSGDEEGLVMGLRHDEYFDLQFGRSPQSQLIVLFPFSSTDKTLVCRAEGAGEGPRAEYGALERLRASVPGGGQGCGGV